MAVAPPRRPGAERRLIRRPSDLPRGVRLYSLLHFFWSTYAQTVDHCFPSWSGLMPCRNTQCYSYQSTGTQPEDGREEV